MKLNATINDDVVIHSFLWKLSERIVSQGVNLLIQVILARMLYPNDFGLLVILIAFVNFGNIFIQSGLSTAIIQKKDLSILDVKTAYTTSIIIAGFLYILLFLAAPYLSKYYNSEILINALRVIALVLFLNAILSVQSAIFMRRMDFKIIFLRSIIAVPLSGIIGIILAYFGFGVWALIAFYISNVLITVLVMNLGTDIKIIFGFSLDSAIKIYNFSIKIIFSNLVSGFYDFFRTILIGKKYSREELAYFDKANSYSFYLVSMVNTSISSVLLPAFSKVQDNKESLLNMAQRATRVTAFIMFPILIGTASIAGGLVQLILTSKWSDCVPYLVMYCILRIPGCMVNIDKQVYYALGRSDVGLYYEIGVLILNLSFIYFMLPYGVWWIIVGSTLVEYIGLIVVCVISNKLYKYTIKQRIKDLIKTVLATAFMYIVIELLKIYYGYTVYTLPLIIFIGLISYLSLSYLINNDSLFYVVNKIKKYRT